MGEIYRARDGKLSRDVAIKVLPADLSRDAAALTRFEREAKAVAALSHPNILAIHDFGTHEGTTYAVMELLEGESLQQRLTEGPLPQRKTLEVARDIALGLAAAHEKGIVHRDLKPANLFLTQDGRVKILDFGLARQIALPSADDTNSPTVGQASEPGFIVGTVGYMAPEQLKGQPADVRSDIFSFGAVLYEMLSGKRAFRGDSAITTMNAILKEDPPSLSESGRQMPMALERIVAHCLEKNPAERFQSARDLAFDLDQASTASGTTPYSPVGAVSRRRRRAGLYAAGLAAALMIGLIAGGRLLAPKRSMAATFRRLTFRRDFLVGAAFAPDAQTVAYSAASGGGSPEIFTVRVDGTGSRPLGIRNAVVSDISKKGEIAIVMFAEGRFWSSNSGTLARVPLGGGAPREILEDVRDAVWAPNGEDLAVTRITALGESSLEYPIGHVLDRSSSHEFRNVRLSPDGNEVAAVERLDYENYSIVMFDRSGKKRDLTTGWPAADSLAWSSGGKEVLFVAGRSMDDVSLRAVDLSGHERVVLPGASDFFLQDVSADGRILLQRYSGHGGILYGTAGGGPERQLAWLDGEELHALSEDGKKILLIETGGEGSKSGAFLRPTDGSAAIRLGDGAPLDFSPDGKWALTKVGGSSPELVLLPTGAGVPRKIQLPGIVHFAAAFLPDGRILILEFPPEGPLRLSVVGVEGGQGHTLKANAPVFDQGYPSSPDGASIAFGTTDHRIEIVSTSGGRSRILPGVVLEPNERLIQWSADGRFLYLCRIGEIPARVLRLDIVTGKRTPWKELQPADPSGVTQITSVIVTRDGQSYAYGYYVVDTSNLYVVSGLK